MTKMQKLYEKFKKFQDDEIVLDVRSKEEFAEGRVPRAINIPHTEVCNHLDELRKYRLIHLHCGSGKRAGIAMEALTKAGLTNIHCIDDSGMAHWIQLGFETEK